MLDIRQRKPLVSPSSGDGEGLFSDTPQPHQLIPSELPRAGCPINPRPRNATEHKAACAAAEGAPVREIYAWETVPGLLIHHNGRFLAVANVLRGPTGITELVFDGADASRLIDLDAPLYILAPAPDAIHAPGAGATADESTAATA